MTIATLKFDLNDPEDAEKFEIHCKAIKQRCARDEFSEYLRRELKHRDITDEQTTLIHEIREKFEELFFGD